MHSLHLCVENLSLHLHSLLPKYVLKPFRGAGEGRVLKEASTVGWGPTKQLGPGKKDCKYQPLVSEESLLQPPGAMGREQPRAAQL